MKKIICAGISAALAASMLCACGSSSTATTASSTTVETTAQEAETTTAAPERLTGGWQAFNASSLATDEEKTILEDAQVNYVADSYEATAVVATQVVSGTNYCYLAKAVNTSDNPVDGYDLVYVYNDLDGKSSILDTKRLVITSDEVGDEMADSKNNLEGGWTLADFEGANVDNKDVFEAAMQGIIGVSYQPIACIATQVVSGTNYCFLAKEIRATANSDEFLALVYVYQDLDGNITLTKANTVDYILD